MTKSNNEEGVTTKEIVDGNLSIAESYEKSNKKTDSYNCTDAAFCGINGDEINPQNAEKYTNDQLAIDSTFEDKSQFTGVSQKDAQFGQSVYYFNNDGYQHAAVYYGTSKDGTVYVFSKNGEYAKPSIMPLKQVQAIYGQQQGIYNQKK